MPTGGGAATYATKRTNRPTSPYVTPGNRRAPTPIPNFGGMGGGWADEQHGYQSPGTQWSAANVPGFSGLSGTERANYLKATGWYQPVTGGYPPFSLPNSNSGGGGGYGGGGGGGGGGPAGLDQAALDWLFGQIGRGRPQDMTYNPLDLPDPSQYITPFDTSQYDVARRGIASGLDAMRARANTAYDAAGTELAQYRNPYAGGLQTRNPDQRAQMAAMARANDATSALQGVAGEGVQADRAFGNVAALMAANDQARQAANLRALAGDRRTTEQNLGLEGNMLNLGVNMGQAKAKSAWQQMMDMAELEAATQEAATNWQRRNTVGDTNVTNRNAWNSGLMQTLLSIIGARAPGTTLPGDTANFYV